MIIAAKAATGALPPLPYTWVVGGLSGVMYSSTSSTAATWTSRTSSFGTSNIYGIRANGIIWVAVGDSGKLATSYDGIDWTQRTSSFGTTRIQNVAFGNGVWVAVGGSGKVATSTDGVNWTQVTTGFTGNVVGIQYGANIWVALDDTGAIRSATNPNGTWTSRTSALAYSQSTNNRDALRWCSSQGVFMAGADLNVTTGAFASSTDGTTWTARNSPATTSASAPQSLFVSNSSVIYVWYYGTSAASQMATSSDGTTWTSRTVPGTFTPASLAVDNTGLLCSFSWISNNFYVHTSTDGITWTSRNTTALVSGGNPWALGHSSGG